MSTSGEAVALVFLCHFCFHRGASHKLERRMSLPIDSLHAALRHSGLVRFLEHYEAFFAGTHLKDLVVDALGPYREMEVRGRQVINFGSDSFLGLDQDPRVQAALMRGVRKW